MYDFDVISYHVFSVIEGTLMNKRSAMWNIEVKLLVLGLVSHGDVGFYDRQVTTVRET